MNPADNEQAKPEIKPRKRELFDEPLTWTERIIAELMRVIAVVFLLGCGGFFAVGLWGWWKASTATWTALVLALLGIVYGLIRAGMEIRAPKRPGSPCKTLAHAAEDRKAEQAEAPPAAASEEKQS